MALPKSVGNTVSDMVVNGESPVSSRSSQCKQPKKETESISNRQRELRQLGLKLRKWEEELKLRETKCNDATKEFTRLEDYVRKTEARNVELEKTIMVPYNVNLICWSLNLV